jgi:hypothetical protein
MLVCFYMVGPKFNPNVFIYSYHIETRSPEWTLPEPTVGSVFLYGRTTRTRTEDLQVKSLML